MIALENVTTIVNMLLIPLGKGQAASSMHQRFGDPVPEPGKWGGAGSKPPTLELVDYRLRSRN